MIQQQHRKKAAALAIATTLVAGFEGLRTYAYRDPVGIPTVCFGETRNVHMGDSYTPAECKAMLADSLPTYADGIDKCLRVNVPDKTYAAFVSFTYNVGVGAFCKSTLLKKANAGDLRGACNELTKWTRAAGIELPGLVRRREEEKAICLAGLG